MSGFDASGTYIAKHFHVDGQDHVHRFISGLCPSYPVVAGRTLAPTQKRSSDWKPVRAIGLKQAMEVG